jgi:hypothetical protein
MTPILRIHPWPLGSMILALLLGATVAFAATDAQDGAVRIAPTVKPGDTIAVTRWSGAKVKGQVMEATECSIVIRTRHTAVEVPHTAIKTVRRYSPPQQTRSARAMFEIAEHCEQVECAPSALAYVGLAALFQGFRDLGRQPEIVYRGVREAEKGVVECTDTGRVSPGFR